MILDMQNFCKSVVDFLQSEYNDGYSFRIERYMALPPEFRPFNKERIELKIEMSPRYRITICNDSMHYLFKLFLEGEYLEDRKQYRWQKELIDMIEGG